MEKKTLFEIRKEVPFVFKIGFTIQEEPIPVNQQKEKMSRSTLKTQNKVDKIKEGFAKIPFEVMDVPSLIGAISDLGFDNFVDPLFPPEDSSIYDTSNTPEYPLDEVPVWKRPHEFMDGRPRLFERTVDPNDIRQGALGNCWFLAAIASLAENPSLVKRLFITDEYNEFGIYQLRICKNGEWVVVTIDDYVPCYMNGGPMFSSANGNELWAILLEKAYAKLHGNYWQLRAGFVSDGMMDLSGCPTKRYKFPENRGIMNKILGYADKFWAVLRQADEKGHIMCGGTPGVDIYTEGGGPNEEHGIVPGHAYSIISAKEYKNIRLLCIRNPWGQFEWGGDWSDNDSKWTREYINAFNPVFDTEDGTFWMSYDDDFFKYFDSMSICKAQNWQELRLKGKFIKVVEQEDQSKDWTISQFYYTFSLDRAAVVEIGLHQEDERILGAERRPNIDMSYIVLKKEDNGKLTVAGIADLESTRD